MRESAINTGRYVFGMTRTGEAQHAVEFDAAGKRRASHSACGQRCVMVYGPSFDGATGVQHPWRCEKCHRAITKAAA